jgi:hypothetical protein
MDFLERERTRVCFKYLFFAECVAILSSVVNACQVR